MAFDPDFVQKQILADGLFDNLNAEARGIIYVVAEIGLQLVAWNHESVQVEKHVSRKLVNAICRKFPGAEVSDPWGGGHDAWKVGGANGFKPWPLVVVMTPRPNSSGSRDCVLGSHACSLARARVVVRIDSDSCCVRCHLPTQTAVANDKSRLYFARAGLA